MGVPKQDIQTVKSALPGGRPGMWYESEIRYRTWTTSDRVAGELVLKPHPCNLMTYYASARAKNFNAAEDYPSGGTFSKVSSLFTWRLTNFGASSISPKWAELDTQTRAKFMGKVRSDPASLGVTLAQWKQAHDMLKSRSWTLLTLVSDFEYRIRMERLAYNAGRKYKHRKKKAPPNRGANWASLYLEFIFGWFPLAQDITRCLEILSQDVTVTEWARSSTSVIGKISFTQLPKPMSNPYGQMDTFTGVQTARSTISGAVEVANSNAWLANQLGVVNLAGVVVDVIPWSFVTGMFWNQAQFVGQLSDTFGLTFKDLSVTRSFKGSGTWTAVGTGSKKKGTHTLDVHSYSNKTRTVGVLPDVTARLKAFDLDAGKSAIFLALAAQKVGRFPPAFWAAKLF